MMLPVVSHLRRKGVLLWVYLDDFLIIAPTIEDCALHTQWLADSLCRLGVQIHTAKSVLTPTRVLVFLGFLLDLQDATVRIPPHKLKSLLHDVRRLMEAETPTCRRCSSVLGRLGALLFAAPQMRLYTDTLAQHVAVLSGRGWETQASLPEEVTIQLELVMEELHQWRGHQFTVDLEKTHMWTDASDYGWGATMQNEMATFGWFSTTQGHIDLKEFRTGVNAIKAYLYRNGKSGAEQGGKKAATKIGDTGPRIDWREWGQKERNPGVEELGRSKAASTRPPEMDHPGDRRPTPCTGTSGAKQGGPRTHEWGKRGKKAGSPELKHPGQRKAARRGLKRTSPRIGSSGNKPIGKSIGSRTTTTTGGKEDEDQNKEVRGRKGGPDKVRRG